MGRQEHKMQAVGYDEFWTGMPASLIQRQHHSFGRTDCCSSGKRLQYGVHGRDVNAGTKPGMSGTANGMDEREYILPDMARLDNRDRTLSTRRPHSAQDGKQANPRFILGPGFNGCIRMGGLDLTDRGSQFFFQASCSAALAAWRWRGR